ncbi:MAG: phosphoglycerate kinase [Candidatus Saccharimonadales bacterium]|nr:phosphoglycerate kinase [Candidatus Saccharimonadales bacterium]
MFPKKTVRDVPIDDRTVLLRTDFNVPLDEHGIIQDDYRIRMALPTINYLRERGCKLIIATHLGRPGGVPDPKLSLRLVAMRLSELLGIEVPFVPQVVGDQVVQTAKTLQPRGVMMIENLRFHPGEKANDPAFAQALAVPAEYFVQEGFAVVHRAHASTSAITQELPSVAGFLVEKEVATIRRAIVAPTKPVAAIIGGSKIQTKIDVIENFFKIANYLIVGGVMANTFLKAMGYKIGKSVYDESEVNTAKNILKMAKRAEIQPILPEIDVAVSNDFSELAQRREVPTKHIDKNEFIMDFGHQSIEHAIQTISHVGTVLWNGPLGVYEFPQFRTASELLARFLAERHVDSIVGGGDTATFLHETGLAHDFTHVSTGGGASLELMAGKPLPGVDSLLDK